MALVTIGAGEDGQVVHSSAKDTIVIRLPENPTTGVRWDVEQLRESMDLVGDDYEQPAGAGIGAGTSL